jgi:hypothetical protein
MEDILDKHRGAYLHWFGISEDDPKNVGYSEVHRAIRAIYRAAFKHAKRSNGTVGEGLFDRLSYDRVNVIKSLYNNLRWFDKDKHKLWSHRNRFSKSTVPEFNRSGIEAAVGDYLALPYRAPEIDRLLVDILMAMEIVAFVNERRLRILFRGSSRALVNQMDRCYGAMNSNGPIRATHVRELLTRATEKGVVWPAPIYPLIDDVIARGGQL